MSFDGFTTRAMVYELNQHLIGGRITKIYQPSEAELLLHIRSHGKNNKLLLSAHPTYPRIQLVQAPMDQPITPPMFCMLMRKYAEGGIIEAIHQVDLERVIHLDFRIRDELGDEVIRRLVVEIMGRHSNLLLIDPLKGTILDAIRRVSYAVSRHRQVFPGAMYQSPPQQHKKNPLKINKTNFFNLVNFEEPLDQQLIYHFTGIGPLLAKEIVYRAQSADPERVWQTFNRLIQQAEEHQYEPTIVQTPTKSFFFVWPLTYLKGETRSFSSISDGLESFFYGKAERERIRQQTHALTRKLKNEIEKNKKKIQVLQRELIESTKSEQHRIYGELLTGYLHQIQKGDRAIEVINYYEEENPKVTISLDPLLTPSQNAQRYFKKYQKLKAGKKWNIEQITQAQKEVDYLESVFIQLENSSLREIEQIREELEEEGWLRKSTKKSKTKAKKEKPVPFTLYASDGTPILIGKNNKQNDYLTHQLATSNDTWLHTKDIPGSHVVIRANPVSETALYEAAMLAAYYSKARESSQVPVDFTLIRYVKKPSGSPPGFVIYEKQQTLFVTPDTEIIRKLAHTSNAVQPRPV